MPLSSIARLEDGGAVAADDAAVAAVSLVDAVRVGLLGGEPAAAEGLGPADFFAAALGSRPGEIGTEPEAFLPVALDAPDRLRRPSGSPPLQAVAVLDPAALGPAGREELAAFAAAGGAVWLTPSATAPADDAGSGVAAVLQALGLPWTPAAADTEAPAPLRADAGAPAPPALPLLAGQWEALLRPIRFDRIVPLDGVDPADSWMSLAGGGVVLAAARAAGPEGEPGAGGTVLWLGAALDPAWTNLPAKPLFPALVRDGLLAAISTAAAVEPVVASPRVGEERAVVAGDGGVTIVRPDAAAANTSAVSPARVEAFFGGLGPVAFLPASGPAEVFPAEAATASLAGGLLWAVLALLVLEAVAGRAFTRA